MDIVKLYDSLKEKRELIKPVWDDIERYCMSGISPANDILKVAKSKDKFNNVAVRSSNILISGLYSHLTNPANNWFMLATDNIQADKMFKDWLYALDSTIKYVLFNSNFYQTIAQFYFDLVHYGIAMLYEEIDTKDIVKFAVFNPKSFVFQEDIYGNVKRIILEIELTAQEASERFGEKNLPDIVLKALKKEIEANKKFKFLGYIYKSQQKDEKIVVVDYVETTTKKSVANIVYHTPEFPYMIIKWNSRTNYVYGDSPSMSALSDAKTINRIMKSTVEAHEKIVNPPLSAPYDGYIEPIYLTPGGINYRTTSDPRDKLEPIITVGNLPASENIYQMIARNIMDAYFVDLFLMEQNPNMTATEVMQRTQEKMLLLGSAVGKLTHSLLTPIIRRTVDILFQTGIVENQFNINPYGAMDIHYLSPLAQAQKSAEFGNIVQFINAVMQYAQVDPTVFDNINADYYTKELSKVLSIPSPMLNDEKTVQAIRQQRQQAQEAEQQAQIALTQNKADKQATASVRDIAVAKKTIGG